MTGESRVSGTRSRIPGVALPGLVLVAPAGGLPAPPAVDPFEAMVVHRPVEPFPAPDLALRSLDGRTVQLKALRGQVLLLGFFTTT